MSKVEGILNFFIRAQELCSRLQQAGQHLSPTIFNQLILTGLSEQYEHFNVQESFNPSGDYTNLRKKLPSYSIVKEQRLEKSASHVAVLRESLSRVTRNNESKKNNNRAIICHVCGLLCHLARVCTKKEGASCDISKEKEYLEKACR